MNIIHWNVPTCATCILYSLVVCHHFRVTSDPLTVAVRELAVTVVTGPNTTTVGEMFDITVALTDAFTRRAVDDIAWRVMSRIFAPS